MSNDRERIDREATERVMRARAEMIQSHTFYGVLVSNVTPKLSRQFPTMATDGKTHFFNPDYVASLTQNKLLGVQRHESEHDARRHHTRRGNRDSKEWNICTDYAINIDLVDEGVELPEGVYVDAKYRGWSAEDIYRARELDRAKEQKEEEERKQAQQEQEEEQAADADAGEDEKESAQADDAADDTGDESSPDGEDDGDNAAQDGDQSDDGAEGETEGAGSGDGDDDTAEQDGDGKADGEADARGDAQADGEADGDSSEGDSDGEGDSEAVNAKSSGDPGGCGEVLDAAETAPELTDEDSKWETILRQAASLAAKRGTAPGHVTREIERADKPPQDWRETLRAWFDQGAQRIETWSRPNRRFIGSGIYLPGSQRDGLNRVVFLIDTSGSMDAIALACIKVEAQAAMDEGIIDEVVVVYGDVRVTRIDTYQNGDEIEFDPRGGGGTDLRPLFQHVRDFVEDCSLIVCFTDGYIGDPGPEPPCPTLWAYTGYPNIVKQMIATAPWNSPAIDVGSH